jgi:hypothetical protein
MSTLCRLAVTIEGILIENKLSAQHRCKVGARFRPNGNSEQAKI